MVDPIKHLSSEALTQIFSHLSTPALTRCNSVSKAWRREILVDSVLHRSMDLMSLGDKVTEMELIQIVHDLAKRSNFKYKELHLDLSPFWIALVTAYRLHRFDDPLTFDKAMGGTGYKYALLINTIFLATKGSLESLFIDVPQGGKRPSSMPVSLSRVIIQGAMPLCEKMDSLKELHFTIPFPFGMSLGQASDGDDRNSKRFTIVQDHSGDDSVEEESLQCLTFLENAIRFTGRGLLQLQIDSRHLVGWQFEFGRAPEVLAAQRQVQLGHFKLFLKQVKSAATFLKDLELAFDEDRVPDTALDLIVNCPNLSSLRLKLSSGSSRWYDVKHIKFPSNASPSTIKFLELEVYHVNLDWDSEALLTWIGSSLQHLTIKNLFRHAKLQVPMSSLLSVLINNPGLESITLENVWIVQPLSSSIVPVISLPKLQYLELDVRPHLGDGMFNNLSATNLKELQVKLRHVGRKPKLELSQEEVKDEQDDGMPVWVDVLPNYDEFEGQGERQEKEADLVFDNLFHLLKACRCSVETLSIQETEDTEECQDRTIEDLKFPKLRILELPQSSARLDQLLSSFSFPRIQKYSNSSDYSASPSIHWVSQMLISSSPSIESLVMGSSDLLWIHPNFSPMLSQSIIDKTIEISNFPKLKTIIFNQATLPFLLFFSQTRLEGSLETIKIKFDYENEDKKDSHFKSLFAVLSANSSSLVKIEVKRVGRNRYATKSEGFVKTKNDLKMLEEKKKNPIEFSNLKSLLIVGCYPLLELFQLSKLPRSSVIRFGASHSVHDRPTQMSSAEFESYDEKAAFRKKEMEREKRDKEQEQARENRETTDESFDEFDSDAERERDAQDRFDQSRHDWI